MIKIEIQSEEVKTKSGTSTRTGKPYSIREQSAYAYFLDRDGNPQPYPQQIRVTLDDGQFPHPKGLYTLAPESLFPDRFGQISIRAKLRPLPQKAQVKEAA